MPLLQMEAHKVKNDYMYLYPKRSHVQIETNVLAHCLKVSASWFPLPSSILTATHSLTPCSPSKDLS